MRTFFTVVILVFVGLVGQCLAQERLSGDIDGDGDVDFADFVLLSENFGRSDGDPFDPAAGPDTVRVVTTEVIRDTIINPGAKLHPKITVFGEPENWHGMPVDFVQHICQITYDIFTRHIHEPFDSNIIILQSDDRGSRLLYSRTTKGEYVMFLARIGTENHLPFIQHFTHEYIHVLGKHWKTLTEHRQLWLQESMAQTASLFMMYHLKTRLARPGNREQWNFVDSSGQLHKAGARIHDQLERESFYWDFYNPYGNGRKSPIDFKNWFYENKALLQNAEHGNANLYLLYSHIAYNLVDIFLGKPEAWNIVDYMCPYGPYALSSDQSLESYLRGWWLRTPLRWQPYVAEIAKRFGIDVHSIMPIEPIRDVN